MSRCFKPTADTRFKLADTSLKSPSAFSIRRKTSSNAFCSSNYCAVFTGRPGQREYCHLIISLPLQGLVISDSPCCCAAVVVVFCLFLFLRLHLQRGCQHESDTLWASGTRQRSTCGLQGAPCCFAYQTMSWRIFISGLWRWHWETDRI